MNYRRNGMGGNYNLYGWDEMGGDGDRESRYRRTYRDWCRYYGKRVDESRYRIFSDNLRRIDNNQRGNRGRINLNEFSDLNPSEYARYVICVLVSV